MNPPTYPFEETSFMDDPIPIKVSMKPTLVSKPDYGLVYFDQKLMYFQIGIVWQ